MSGLTWDQLARLFGVSRRAVHSWASGGIMNARNEARVHRVLAFMLRMDRGQARENRSLLLSCDDSGNAVLNLLADGRFDDAQAIVKHGIDHPKLLLQPLSIETRTSRKPASPVELLTVSDERVHKEEEKLADSLTGRALRIK